MYSRLKTNQMMVELERVFDRSQAQVLTQVMSEAFSDLVRTGDFNELKEIVRELAIAQRELVVAQRGSEKRLTRVENAIVELTAAQEKTETRIVELIAAQEKTEACIAELTEAQKQTEMRVAELAEGLQVTRRQLGGLSETVGYGLENLAYHRLPELLKRDLGIVVEGRLTRQHVKDNTGKELEVNIIGKGVQNGAEVVILGESKAQLSKNNVDAFIKKRIERLRGVFAKLVPVMVTHMTSSADVEGYARERGIAVYYSYDLE